jgi:hypothetical protein
MRRISLLGFVALASVISPPSADSTVEHADAHVPLSFEPNRGQTDPRVDYLSRGPGYTLFLSSDEAVLSFPAATPASRGGVVRMNLLGARGDAVPLATDERPGKVNYFVGDDPSRWLTGIPTYARTTYPDVYPGIDVVYYGHERQLEYDFVVRPGASATSIAVRFEGAERVDVEAAGELAIHINGGVLRNRKPRMYQVVDGREHIVAGGYVRRGDTDIGFEVAPYDQSLPLVIDPVVVYSTLIGAVSRPIESSEVRSIAVDASGNVYIAGLTGSTVFPTSPDAYDVTPNGPSDVFVSKLDATGSTLLYSTYIGGRFGDAAYGIAVDRAGNAYVTGHTSSSDFPTTIGAFDTQIDTYHDDAFVAKLNATGSTLVYSTYLGGMFSEAMNGRARIAVDERGSAFVTAGTTSRDFPTTPGAVDPAYNGEEDTFVTRLNAAGSGLMFSTFLGGRYLDLPDGIAIDSAGNAYVAGITGSANFPTTAGALDLTLDGTRDAFVTKLNASGSALVYSTYVGGSAMDEALGIAIDTSGSAYIAGDTWSSDFPVTGEAFRTRINPIVVPPNYTVTDAFVAKLNSTGSNLVYATYFGSTGYDTPSGIAVDNGGYAFVTGAASSDLPLERPLDVGRGGGRSGSFLIYFNRTGSAPVYSTFLGGATASAIALDAAGNAYVAGRTGSPNFFTTPGAFDTTPSGGGDGFVMKISDAAPPVRITLAPRAASAFVDARHCVTGIAEDAAGRRIRGIAVRFDVTGAIDASGVATTDENGRAEFCYPGSLRPGLEQVEAQPLTR